MAEKNDKGVIIEYDFAAMNGAEVLFDTTKAFLNKLDKIPFDAAIEGRYFAGGNLQGALAEYFSAVKTKKTPAKAAKDIDELFRANLAVAMQKSVTSAFRAFVAELVDHEAMVIISTRAEIEKVDPAFEDVLSDRVVLYHEESTTYGSVKWDAWRRACVASKLHSYSTLAVTGSGFGVKSALTAGLPSVGVITDHTAYQDYSGADEMVRTLDVSVARKICEILRLV